MLERRVLSDDEKDRVLADLEGGEGKLEVHLCRSRAGQPQKAAKLNRVPAAEIERLIVDAVRKHLGMTNGEWSAPLPTLIWSQRMLPASRFMRISLPFSYLSPPNKRVEH